MRHVFIISIAIALGALVGLQGCMKVPDDQQNESAARDTDTAPTVTDNLNGTEDNTDSAAPAVDQNKSASFVRWESGPWGDLMVDNETGCEYIVAYANGRPAGTALPPTPRMDAHGKQICRDYNKNRTYDPKADGSNPASRRPVAKPTDTQLGNESMADNVEGKR